MNKSLAPTVFAMLIAGATAHADVTVQNQMTMNLAMIKAHVSSTDQFTDDKKRSESEFRCDGFMSMLCGKNDSLEIIRLDQSLTRHGDAKKKTYTESPIPTPDQRKAMEEAAQAELEKMKSCPTPTPTNTPAVDTSKCQLSPPTTNVSNPGDSATFAGHAAHHTIMTMTQSCANPQTGESCDMSYTFDLWLANDDIPEMASRQTFDKNYMHALGMDSPGAMSVPAQLTQFLSPYKDAMQKMASESGGLKGFPLKSTFRVAMGGPHCGSTKNGSAGGSSGGSSGGIVGDAGSAAAGAAASSSESVATSAAADAATRSAGGSVGGYIAGSAAGAFASKMIGGLFNKGKQAATAPSSQGSAAAPAPTAPGMMTVAEITSETTAISGGGIPANQFEIPADWKKVEPKQKAEKEFTCPKVGS
jgi:hypothetical protein